MHCIIPAAGKGTRMRPLTWSIPKPLIPVAGKPILAHVIDSLIISGVDHITLIVGYLGEVIVNWAKEKYSNLQLDFVFQENADGLASAVLLAENFVTDAPSLVVLGDTLFSADLTVLKNETRNMIVASYVEDPSRFGVVVFENGKVVKLVEKPPEPISNLAIVGVYYFASGKKLMNYCHELQKKNIKTKGEFQLTDAMQLMLENNEPFGTLDIDGWYDCGNPETLLETNRELLIQSGGFGNPILENSVIIQPCCFGENTVIKNSVIGPYFSGGSELMVKNSVIGNTIASEKVQFINVLLSNSVVGAGASIKKSSFSVYLGNNSVVEK